VYVLVIMVQNCGCSYTAKLDTLKKIWADAAAITVAIPLEVCSFAPPQLLNLSVHISQTLFFVFKNASVDDYQTMFSRVCELLWGAKRANFIPFQRPLKSLYCFHNCSCGPWLCLWWEVLPTSYGMLRIKVMLASPVWDHFEDPNVMILWVYSKNF